ncbi:tyrosine-protein kinase Tec-like [Sycon ciliatum]|uniref:tyrosine-protein kinase Tec-like n=1 Tax=Sycon ciliatum TaxID=27933 RepID=UPI0031F6E32D
MAASNQEIKCSRMVKRSQGKSRLGPVNYKDRVFVLTKNTLAYHEGNLAKRGSEKGRIEISRVKAVEHVDESAFERPYAFQVVHDNLTLYIIAGSKEEVDSWVAVLQEQVQHNGDLLQYYHPGVFTSNKWTCCHHNSRLSLGCKATFVNRRKQEEQQRVAMQQDNMMAAPGGGMGPGPSVPPPARPGVSAPGVPGAAVGGYSRSLPPVPNAGPPGSAGPPVAGGPHMNGVGGHQPQLPFQASNTLPQPPQQAAAQASGRQPFDVIAVYDYTSPQQGDLPMKKGQRLTVFDDSREHWWHAQNAHGDVGFIPANYVRRIGIESEEWFHSDITRQRAEALLRAESKEGTFLVRNSSRGGMYTLSVSHADVVRHYHIRQDDDRKYYISDRHRFETIPELIEYHQLNGGGLVTRLRNPPRLMKPQEPPTRDKWEIDPADLSFGRELGSGQFGVVMAGKYKGTIEVAIKMMKEGTMAEEDFIDEAKVMKNFQHPNLVQLYGVVTVQRPIFIVTELMCNGCLLTYIRNHPELQDRPDVLIDMTLQICGAMKFLETSKFIHRDLAARNCLIGERYQVKVGDFGLARYVLDDEYTASEGTKFPIKWAAPEVISFAKFSSKSDVWSFGVLVWELFSSGKQPYPTFSNSQVLDEVLRGYRLERPQRCPPEVYEIVSTTWHKDLEERPSFDALYGQLQLLGDDYMDANS